MAASIVLLTAGAAAAGAATAALGAGALPDFDGAGVGAGDLVGAAALACHAKHEKI